MMSPGRRADEQASKVEMARPKPVIGALRRGAEGSQSLSLETGKHICVVVARGDSDERFVVTAYLTSRIKQGNELWKK